jgi:hypothetical protein
MSNETLLLCLLLVITYLYLCAYSAPTDKGWSDGADAETDEER